MKLSEGEATQGAACLCGRALLRMSLQDRDKTTAYSEACLWIREPSPKSTFDTRRHPSDRNDGLAPTTNCLPWRPRVSPNRFFCSDAFTRAGLTGTCTCVCKFTSLWRPRMSFRPARGSVLLSDSRRRACNSWPPFFNLITSYQSGAGGSGSSGSHIPAQLPTPSPPPPHCSHNISHSTSPHLIPRDTASCVCVTCSGLCPARTGSSTASCNSCMSVINVENRMFLWVRGLFGSMLFKKETWG